MIRLGALRGSDIHIRKPHLCLGARQLPYVILLELGTTISLCDISLLGKAVHLFFLIK